MTKNPNPSLPNALAEPPAVFARPHQAVCKHPLSRYAAVPPASGVAEGASGIKRGLQRDPLPSRRPWRHT
ncbi:MAG: hypothetical protein AAF320_06720, partial [Myxococcota bacterium]